MKGARKIIIGLAFLAGATFISYEGIKNGSDLLGVGTVIGAIAGGVFGIVWGNAQEHKAENSGQPKQ